MKKYYVGMDVHKATIAIAVLDAFGKLIAQSVIETSTQAVRDFFHTLRGEAHVTSRREKTLYRSVLIAGSRRDNQIAKYPLHFHRQLNPGGN